MLALLGLATVLTVLVLIMSRLSSPLVALIAAPIAGALVGGFGPRIGAFVVAGIQQTAPVAAMFVFAILYFGVMTDAGMLDPIVDRILSAVGNRPRRIVMGTALLALLVHLDGSGAVTFLVTVPTMLPLYERLHIDKRVLACVASMAAGVNFLPWTGPMLRASAALHIPTIDLFRPLIPVQAVGLVCVFGVAWWLGGREERRVAAEPPAPVADVAVRSLSDEAQRLRRPHLFWANLGLTLCLMAAMISGMLDAALDVHDRHGDRAAPQLPRRRRAARPHRRAREGRGDDGGDSHGGRGLHRHHERVGHAERHGPGGGRRSCRRGWRATFRWRSA